MLNRKVRQPAVAGQFYPAQAKAIKNQITEYLKQTKDDIVWLDFKVEKVKAVITPHAGYDYSGRVAAYAYQAVAGRQTRTALIIGNAHAAYFSGIAVDESDFWQTPLGEVAVDKNLAEKLNRAWGVIKFSSTAHINDHCLEVQLPFLQIVLPAGFKILPLLFGKVDEEGYKKLADILSDILMADDLVVISTDLSHYPAYEEANRIDKKTLEIIKTLNINKLNQHIAETMAADIANEETLLCGLTGVKTVMELANLKKWEAKILKYLNSGEALIGDKRQVVGYGAMAFLENENLKAKSEELLTEMFDLNIDQKVKLLEIAKASVEEFVRYGRLPDFKITDERLKQKQGAFVTLKKNGRLRGCLGQIQPTDKPLWQVVRDMAVEAASADPRFPPVSTDELDGLDYEVSVLSVPKKIDDWRKIELGKHGVIIKKGWRAGVFLPQVAEETGWNLEEFLSQLSWQKAGLPPDAFKNDKNVELQIFTATVFGKK